MLQISWNDVLMIMLNMSSLRAKRSERERASGASFTSLMGTSRKAVSGKRSILDIWCWEQKVFVLTQLVDIWSEPARPDPTRPDPARPGPARPSRF